jgi:hypothetical protein
VDVNGANSTIVFKTFKNDNLKLASTNIYTALPSDTPISSLSSNIGSMEGWFAKADNITLTFTKAIPTGSTLKAALSRSSLNGAVTQSISLATSLSTDRKTLIINPTVDMEAAVNTGTQYYLAVEITKDGQTLVNTSTLAPYSGSLLYVSGQDIQFKTKPGVVYTSAQSGDTSATSPELSASGSYVSGSSSLKWNGTYHVQFDKPLKVTFAPANKVYATNDSEVTITFAIVGDHILSITPRYTVTVPSGGSAPTKTSISVTLGGSGTNGTINTQSGTFSISSLTVQP